MGNFLPTFLAFFIPKRRLFHKSQQTALMKKMSTEHSLNVIRRIFVFFQFLQFGFAVVNELMIFLSFILESFLENKFYYKTGNVQMAVVLYSLLKRLPPFLRKGLV